MEFLRRWVIKSKIFWPKIDILQTKLSYFVKKSANIWLSRIIRIILIFFKNMYLCSLGDHFWQRQFFYTLYSNIMPNIWHLFIKYSDFLRLCWFLAKNIIFYDPPSKTFHNRTDSRLGICYQTCALNQVFTPLRTPRISGLKSQILKPPFLS